MRRGAGTGGAGRALGARARPAGARARARSRLPAGPRHGLGARPGAAAPTPSASGRGCRARCRPTPWSRCSTRSSPGCCSRSSCSCWPWPPAGSARRGCWTGTDEPAGLVVRLVAVTVYGWNALVAERLLMGAWPVLVGYAVLPWLLGAARRWRAEDRLPRALLVLVPLGCLSASAGLATAVAVLAGAAGKGRTAKARPAGRRRQRAVAGRRAAARVVGDVGLRGRRGVRAARLRDRFPARSRRSPWAGSGTPPSSRTRAPARSAGWRWSRSWVWPPSGPRSWWRRTPGRERTALLVCWVVGWTLAVLTWLAPGLVGWASEHVAGRRRRPGRRPGAGALRAAAGRAGGRGRAGAGDQGASGAGGSSGARRRCRPAPRGTAARPGLRRRAPHRAGRLPGGVRRGARRCSRTGTATCWCCRCPATARPPGTTGTWCWTRSAAT